MSMKDSLARVRRLWARMGWLGDDVGRRRLLAVVAAGLLAALALAGGLVAGAGDDEPAAPVPEASRERPAEGVSFLARLVPPPADRRRSRGPNVPRSVSDLAARLPLERKVAQLFLFGFRGNDLQADIYRRLRRMDLGGIVIDRGNYAGPQLLGEMAGEARVIAGQERHVPPWVMAAQQGGDFNALPDLPPPSAPADLGSAGQGGSEAADAGRTLKPLGVTGVLGPTLGVGSAEESALGGLVYSDDPAEVAGYAEAAVTAYRRAGVFTAVAHFPGLGAASQSTEEGPAQVGLGLEALKSRDLAPFRAAVEAGTPGILVGHGLYTVDDFTVPASLSSEVIGGLLRRDTGFRGVALTDDLADPAVTAFASVPEASVRALRAGADMLYVSGPAGDQQAAYVAVLRAVQRGKLSRRRLDEALSRVLLAKQRYGLIRRR